MADRWTEQESITLEQTALTETIRIFAETELTETHPIRIFEQAHQIPTRAKTQDPYEQLQIREAFKAHRTPVEMFPRHLQDLQA